MSENWVEVAQKMAENARKQLAIDRQRLQEIMQKRNREQTKQEPPADVQ